MVAVIRWLPLLALVITTAMAAVSADETTKDGDMLVNEQVSLALCLLMSLSCLT